MNAPPSRDQLRQLDCEPLSGRDALTPDAIASFLTALPHWSESDGALQAVFRFSDWWETVAFVNALAWMVHRQDHHPELGVAYDRCTVRFDTHSAGGITLNDFICAARTDAIYDARPRP